MPETDALLELVPPTDQLKRVGPIFDTKTYLATGRLSVGYLQRYAGLKPHHSVLDVGCGFGRVAIHLLPLIKTYFGFDVVRSEIDWCQNNITKRNANFRFAHLDVKNKRYNPKGSLSAENVKFPIGEMTFDLVFLISVFTHMLPKAIEGYLREIHRHLEPDGTLLASFFLINEDSARMMNAGVSTFNFKKQDDFYSQSAAIPEGAVAYDEQQIVKMLRAAGFSITALHYGRWPGRTQPDHGQDFIVCQKA